MSLHFGDCLVPECPGRMILRKRTDSGYFLTCNLYPESNNQGHVKCVTRRINVDEIVLMSNTSIENEDSPIVVTQNMILVDGFNKVQTLRNSGKQFVTACVILLDGVTL